MKSSHDPSLTSWALNELSAAERAAFDEELKKNPELLAEAETTLSFCRFVQNHLRDERAALTDAQRARLKTAASGNTQQGREDQATSRKVIKPKVNPWWRNPSHVLPLSVAAAVAIGLVPYLSRKLSPSESNEGAAPVMVATATPKPEPTRSVLSPAPFSAPVATNASEHLAALQSVKLVSDVESKLKSAPRGPLEIDVAQLQRAASGAARIVKSGAGTLILGDKTSDSLGRLVSYNRPSPAQVFTATVLGTGGITKVGGGTMTLAGNNTYTGGTVVNGGVMNVGFSTTSAADGYMGEPTNARGTVTLRGGFKSPTTGSIDEFSYRSDESDQKPIQFGDSTVTFSGGGNLTARSTETPSLASFTTSGGTMVINGSAGTSVSVTAKDAAGVSVGGVIFTSPIVPSPTPNVALAPKPVKAMAGPSETSLERVSSVTVNSTKNFGNMQPGMPARPSMQIDGKDRLVALQTLPEKQLPELLSVVEQENTLARKAERASGESYAPITENALAEVAAQPLSTFSIDVDTAAYANVRRFLNNGQRPPADAVRIEEMINYFPYDYEFPQKGEAPFTVAAAVAEAPWSPTHRLARIAIKARDVGMERRRSNFVFLVDVSGSMDEPNKLPLVRQSLGLLTDGLTEDDRVAIVTYAGSSGLVLASTTGDKKTDIRRAISEMKAGGSTHGSAGIRQAYEEAQRSFIKEGVNRVILCTDGDFNVGIASTQELENFIKEKATSGVFLSVLGYGTGNTKDTIMETLADKGNGNYAYIDSLSEARKVLVEQMRGTLVTIAKDVKIQVEFNPSIVRAYRLIGYENRMLAKEDFNNDAKDAGEIGAGHTVTALYEIVPVGAATPDGRLLVDALKYQAVPAAAPSDAAKSGEMMTVKLRYKKPDGDKSTLIDFPVKDEGRLLKDSEREFKFATAVAGFGLLLRNSSYKGDMTWEHVRQLAISAKGEDPSGYRGEFIQLIDKARGIMGDGRP